MTQRSHEAKGGAIVGAFDYDQSPGELHAETQDEQGTKHKKQR
jgi:hypothetical protein